MSKLLSSLVAASIAGTFSLAALATDAPTPPAAPAAEKPAAAPKKVQEQKKHTVKAEEKKHEAVKPMTTPAEPAKK